MAYIDYDGFKGIGKQIALWTTLSVVCGFASKISLGYVLGAAAWGALVGTLAAYWLSKLQLKRITYTELAGILLLVGCLLLLKSRFTLLGAFSLGALYKASLDVMFAWLGQRGLDRFNKKNASKLSMMELNIHKSRVTVPENSEEARETFLTLLPQPLQAEVRACFVPIIGFRTVQASEPMPQDTSSLGGDALLPNGSSWPIRDGKPLDYLARINLSELAAIKPSELPSKGILSFFFDKEQPWGDVPEDRGSGVILFSPDPAQCLKTAPPDRSSSINQPIQFYHHIGFDMPENVENRFYDHYRSSPPESKAPLDLLHDHIGEDTHCELRVMSPPSRVQNDMDRELRTAAQAHELPEDTQWTMLLQLDSVAEQDWCWGDAGCLYFWIPTQDLAAARFDRVWVVLQCS